MATIGIIPAKGQSVGVPKKNTKYLGGKMLVDWTIHEAVQSRELDKIYFTSENLELLQHAQEYANKNEHFYVISRPPVLAHNNVQVDIVSWLTLLQSEYTYQENKINDDDIIVILQPTSPFRTSVHIDEAVELFRLFQDLDVNTSLVSVMTLRKFIYFSNDYRESYIEPANHNPTKRKGRESYDIDEMPYVENGALYICNAGYIMDNHTFRSHEIVPYVMDDHSSIEIDTIADWKKAEQIIEEQMESAFEHSTGSAMHFYDSSLTHLLK